MKIKGFIIPVLAGASLGVLLSDIPMDSFKYWFWLLYLTALIWIAPSIHKRINK